MCLNDIGAKSSIYVEGITSMEIHRALKHIYIYIGKGELVHELNKAETWVKMARRAPDHAACSIMKVDEQLVPGSFWLRYSTFNVIHLC